MLVINRDIFFLAIYFQGYFQSSLHAKRVSRICFQKEATRQNKINLLGQTLKLLGKQYQ